MIIMVMGCFEQMIDRISYKLSQKYRRRRQENIFGDYYTTTHLFGGNESK